MATVIHRGQRIHYEVRGQGPTVVLQHGLFSRGSRWEMNGYVDRLAADYRVVWVDSLAHGDSDKPHEAALYSREQRAGDLAAVFDAVGADRVHLVGYSMGSWMATGVAIHHPGRLASLTLGGWDPVRGVQVGGGLLPGFKLVLSSARARLPEVVEWVTPELEPALSACWGALGEVEGVGEALEALRCPVMLWSGASDPFHKPMQTLASARRFAFLSTLGDHADAMVLETPRVVARLRALFEEGERG